MPEQTIFEARIARQLRQFLRLLIAVGLIFGSIYLIVGQATDASALRVLAAGMVFFVAGCLVALLTVDEQHLIRAFAITCTTILLTAICIVVAVPKLLPTTIFFVVAASVLPMLVRSRRLFLVMGVSACFTTLILWVVSSQPSPFTLPAMWDITPLIPVSMMVSICGLVLLFYFIWSNMTEALIQREQSNSLLSELRDSLEQQVEDRTAALGLAITETQQRAIALEKLSQENTQQREQLREMSVPVLPVLDGTLVVPLIGELDSERLDDLLDQALAAVSRERARWLVLDITGVLIIDTLVARGLREVMETSRLLGATILIVGVRPEVAQTMIGLGITFDSVRTQPTLRAAIEYIRLSEARHTSVQPNQAAP